MGLGHRPVPLPARGGSGNTDRGLGFDLQTGFHPQGRPDLRRAGPLFAGLERQLQTENRRFEEAQAAQKFNLGMKILDRYGKKILKIPARLGQLEKRVSSLLPVRGSSPRKWLGALRNFIAATTRLGNGTRNLARNPTEKNATLLQATVRQTDRADSSYRKTGRSYGLRACAKPLGIN